MRHLFAWLCVLLSFAIWWSTIGALRGGAVLGGAYIAVVVTASALFIGTAFAAWRMWRGWRWFAGSSGGLLVLYGVSVILIGWEDVGGAAVAIPLSALTGLGGCVGLALALKPESSHGAA
jgi:hypothetical protein